MADIFVSYSRADAARVQQLAAALAENGWTVWWDRSIQPGTSFDEVIEAELNAARCVIVLWSGTSISSSWVKEEAEEGLQRGVLTPVMIDDTRPPLGFRRVQAANLADWDGNRSHHGYQQLIGAVRALLDDASTVDAEALSTPVQVQPQADEAPPVQAAVERCADTPTATTAGSPAQPASSTSSATPTRPAAATAMQASRWPLWLGPVGALTAVTAVFLMLNWNLAGNADGLLGRIDALSRQPAVQYVATQPSLPPPPTREAGYFVTALENELASGVVTLQFSDTEAVMVLSGDGLFQSGRESVNELSRPVLAHIGRVLADWPHGPIDVIAHTDNVPIRTLRFPSNRDLSAARAEAVADILRQQLAPGADVRAEGRGGAEPLTDNSTRESRARNRRVEIKAPLL